MQKKHQKKNLVVGVPTFGEGEGSSRLGQNPKFTQKNYWTAPLKINDGWQPVAVSAVLEQKICLPISFD